MKINLVLPTPDLSGGWRVLATYADRLQRRGHDVTCIWSARKPYTLREKVRSLRHGNGWPRMKQEPSHFDEMNLPFVEVSPARAVRNQDVPDGDVVVATWWETAEWVAALAPSKGAKAYFIQHDESLFEGVPAERAARTWQLPMHKITISQWLLERARNEYGDDDVSLVLNSVDTDQFHAPRRKRQATPTVGLLYSTTRFKGCEVSLEAFRLAAQRVPGLQLIAFGAEPVSTRLPLPPRSEFHCRPAQSAIKDLYARCDVWLCGSRSEGFHLPPLEAMACRCPVVSTRVGGAMDVIDEGVNGHLVAVGDAVALSDRLVDVLSLSDERWMAMSDAAWETARRYSWDDAAGQFEQALYKAADISNLVGASRN